MPTFLMDILEIENFNWRNGEFATDPVTLWNTPKFKKYILPNRSKRNV